jgi:hypothetical protein
MANVPYFPLGDWRQLMSQMPVLHCNELSRPSAGLGHSRHFGRGFELRLLPRKQSRRYATGAAVQGHERPFALQKNSEPFRHRAAVKYAADPPIGT